MIAMARPWGVPNTNRRGGEAESAKGHYGALPSPSQDQLDGKLYWPQTLTIECQKSMQHLVDKDDIPEQEGGGIAPGDPTLPYGPWGPTNHLPSLRLPHSSPSLCRGKEGFCRDWEFLTKKMFNTSQIDCLNYWIKLNFQLDWIVSIFFSPTFWGRPDCVPMKY